MDQATATTKYVRVSPRKARLIANLIRGLTVDAALSQLTFSQMKAGRHLKKTVNSALANFEMNIDTKGRDKKLHIQVYPILGDCQAESSRYSTACLRSQGQSWKLPSPKLQLGQSMPLTIPVSWQ